MEDIVQIIGLDLGHGETAIARTLSKRDSEPELLEIYEQKSQVTALAMTAEGKYVIGVRAIREPGVTWLDIGFKRRPSADQKEHPQLRTFMEVVYNELKDKGYLIDEEETAWFVGCPSAWSDDERNLYQEWLQLRELPLLTIVRESRAALLKVRNTKESALTVSELRSEILVIDIGASTTDFTLLHSIQSDEPLDFGVDLGASLIDKAIMRYAIAQSNHREEIEAIFRLNPVEAQHCEFRCRQAKEQFFSEIGKLSTPSNNYSVTLYHPVRQLPLLLDLNGPTMHKILEQPLPELDNHSWIDFFYKTLSRVRKQLTAAEAIPKVVLVTGGASRMSFVQEICTEIFPSPETRFQRDSEPEFAIAKGLALWGRIHMLTDGFVREVEIALETVEPMLQQNLPKFTALLIDLLTEGLITQAIKPALRDWQKARIQRLTDVENQIAMHATKWLEHSETKRQIEQRLIAWFDPIQDQLNDRTFELCRKYDIPPDALRISLSYDPTRPHLSGLTPRSFRTNTMNGIGNAAGISAGIASYISGLALMVAAASSLTIPVIGVLIGIVLGGAAMWGSVPFGASVANKAKQKMEQWNVPTWMRDSLLSDSQINTIDKKISQTIRDELHKQLANDSALNKELIQRVSADIKTDLHERSDTARILIN